jgi:hypothetical protein
MDGRVDAGCLLPGCSPIADKETGDSDERWDELEATGMLDSLAMVLGCGRWDASSGHGRTPHRLATRHMSSGRALAALCPVPALDPPWEQAQHRRGRTRPKMRGANVGCTRCVRCTPRHLMPSGFIESQDSSIQAVYVSRNVLGICKVTLTAYRAHTRNVLAVKWKATPTRAAAKTVQSGETDEQDNQSG